MSSWCIDRVCIDLSVCYHVVNESGVAFQRS